MVNDLWSTENRSLLIKVVFVLFYLLTSQYKFQWGKTGCVTAVETIREQYYLSVDK